MRTDAQKALDDAFTRNDEGGQDWPCGHRTDSHVWWEFCPRHGSSCPETPSPPFVSARAYDMPIMTAAQMDVLKKSCLTLFAPKHLKKSTDAD